MKQATTEISRRTFGKGLFDITGEVASWVEAQGIREGLLTVFVRHTSASLTIQENADPSVLTDLEAYFAQRVPEDPGAYRHGAEGPDDMPAHIRCSLTDVSLSIPVLDGGLALGTWQGIFLWEHRSRPHDRKVALHLIGE